MELYDIVFSIFFYMIFYAVFEQVAGFFGKKIKIYFFYKNIIELLNTNKETLDKLFYINETYGKIKCSTCNRDICSADHLLKFKKKNINLKVLSYRTSFYHSTSSLKHKTRIELCCKLKKKNGGKNIFKDLLMGLRLSFQKV